MIINTNPSEEQQQTIDYIRNLTNNLMIPQNQDHEVDSLALSLSEHDSLNLDLVTPRKKKQRKKQESNYVSPYKQSSLSMRKIMKSKQKHELALISYPEMFIARTEETKGGANSSRTVNSPSKYRTIPSLIETYEKNEGDKMKAEARLLYESRERNKEDLSNSQKNTKWADFLLRERRWQSGKQDRKNQAEQKVLAREVEDHRICLTARDYPAMNIEQNIKMVNRKKIKLKSQLRQNLLNFYTWNKPISPAKERSRSPKPTKVKQNSVVSSAIRSESPLSVKEGLFIQSRQDRKVHLSNNKELAFLINKNR